MKHRQSEEPLIFDHQGPTTRNNNNNNNDKKEFQSFDDEYDDENSKRQNLLLDSELNRTSSADSRLRTFAGVCGNILEWYDFSLFATFSDVIGKVFFPPPPLQQQQGNPRQLIESFVVFGTACFLRPVGGIILGYIGDKYGRQLALEISIFLMAFPTFLMGCLPSYQTAGELSYILLVMVRMLQGLSVGGQLMASLCFTLESKPQRVWGFYGGYVFGATNVGTFLGSLVGALLRSLLTPEQLLSWGWRIPFLSGILVTGVALYLRYYSSSTDASQQQQPDPPENPIRQAFATRENRRALLSAVMVPTLNAAGFHIIFVWLPIFMAELLQPSIPHAFWVSTAALFLDCFNYPLAGWISDQFDDRRSFMTFGAILVIIGSPLMVHLISLGNPIVAFSAMWSLSFSLSFYSSPTMAWLMETFTPEVRLTSTATGYSIAQGLVGGILPALSTYLAANVSHIAPGIILSMAGIVGLVGLRCVGGNNNKNNNLEWWNKNGGSANDIKTR